MGAAWRLHWLEAEHGLAPYRAPVTAAVEACRRRVAALMDPPAMDILVQILPGQVIPEIGMVGHAYGRSLFALTLDPGNAHFARCLGDGTLERQVAHEVHHCLRARGPGYGRTLGEALVSEGLAGQFVRRLYGNPPEPWECAVDAAALRAHWPDAAALAGRYDHHAWFFGTSDGRMPRWLGYTMGYAIAGAWLRTAGEIDGRTWAEVPAATVLAAAAPPVA